MYFLVLWKVEMAESHPTTFPFAIFVLLNFGNRMMIYSELYMCVYASQFYLYEFIIIGLLVNIIRIVVTVVVE